MSVNRLKNFYVETCKTINNLNPEFTNNIFKVKENKRLANEQYELNFEMELGSFWRKKFESIQINGLKQPSF